MSLQKVKEAGELIEKLTQILRKHLHGSRPTLRDEFIDNCCKFWVNNIIDGDYYEFGVYQGETSIKFAQAFYGFLSRRISTTGSLRVAELRRGLRDNVKFHLFDSFNGLPELSGVDTEGHDFEAGQYSSDELTVIQKIHESGLDRGKFEIHSGWFKNSIPLFLESNFRKAAIINIDCDLYQSAVDVLNNIGGLLQDGTILIFDDWHCFNGNPQKGVQLAFNEWRTNVELTDYTVSEYLSEGWSTKSFVVSKKLEKWR